MQICSCLRSFCWYQPHSLTYFALFLVMTFSQPECAVDHRSPHSLHPYPLWRCCRCGCWSGRACLWAASGGSESVWHSGCRRLQLCRCCLSVWIYLKVMKCIKTSGWATYYELQAKPNFQPSGCSSFFPTSIGRSCGAKMKQQLSGYITVWWKGVVGRGHKALTLDNNMKCLCALSKF